MLVQVIELYQHICKDCNETIWFMPKSQSDIDNFTHECNAKKEEELYLQNAETDLQCNNDETQNSMKGDIA